jgi:GDP-L-fucose synthase
MRLEGKRILVTGGGGFLGSSLVHRLAREGHRVRATFHRGRAPICGEPVEWMRADLTRAADCARATRGIDVVFHFAANTSGAAVMVETPLVHVTTNVVMNTLLLEAAHAAGVERLVFPSSGAAYPPTGDRPVTEPEMFTGEPYPAYYPVASMKRFTELLCEMYARRVKAPMSTVVVRPSNVFGPGDKFDPRTSHVTAALVRKVAERLDPLEVWGTGDDVRDLIYIDDFLDGLLLAAQVDEPHFVVNVASGRGYSVREILDTLLEIDGWRDADVRYDPTKPSTIPVRLMSDDLARRALGFAPKVDLREGLARTLDGYRLGSMGREVRRAS